MYALVIVTRSNEQMVAFLNSNVTKIVTVTRCSDRHYSLLASDEQMVEAITSPINEQMVEANITFLNSFKFFHTFTNFSYFCLLMSNGQI